jgi:hypothetical protein
MRYPHSPAQVKVLVASSSTYEYANGWAFLKIAA